ncbi:esterase [Arsenicibacter rosenii]|uniref:Esterase n=2 Tax=Arsenicibacter rosenii TaxID=1750698 RepID=A0A1S2VN06_9BACT|nr:esterase [Arsenicibacter rosenii]
MHVKALGLAIALFIGTLPAMSQDVIKLWPDGAVPNAVANPNFPEKSEVGQQDGILRISHVSVPTLTVFQAPKDKATGAAVMICPGGGYGILAFGHEGEEVARWFNQQGITAFILKYRLPDERLMTNQSEVPLMDAMQGMKLIRQQAAKYGLDVTKIGVMGFSAGGHLAATLSTHYHRSAGSLKASEEAKPNFAILMYPVVTFGAKAHGGSRNNLLGKQNTSAELIAYYSNELQVTKQTPPTFLVHAQDDKAVPVENSIDYYLALLKNDVSGEMHLYPTGGHGFALRTKGKGSIENWPDACKGWLKAQGLMK